MSPTVTALEIQPKPSSLADEIVGSLWVSNQTTTILLILAVNSTVDVGIQYGGFNGNMTLIDQNATLFDNEESYCTFGIQLNESAGDYANLTVYPSGNTYVVGIQTIDITNVNNNTNENENNNELNIHFGMDALGAAWSGNWYILIIVASVAFLVLFGLAVADLSSHSKERRF